MHNNFQHASHNFGNVCRDIGIYHIYSDPIALKCAENCCLSLGSFPIGLEDFGFKYFALVRATIPLASFPRAGLPIMFSIVVVVVVYFFWFRAWLVPGDLIRWRKKKKGSFYAFVIFCIGSADANQLGDVDYLRTVIFRI
jgi:hypothetical protein